MGIIYCARNKVNGKRYIGKSSVSMEFRKARHESLKSGSVIASAIRKYGAENFEWSVIFEDVPDDQLNEFEIDAIAVYNTLAPNGYNLRTGGEGGKHSEETKRKLSEVHKNPSAETRKKLSVARRNRPPASKETRTKISLASKGKKLSEQAKENMKIAQQKRTHWPGRIHSEETKKRQSESAKNRSLEAKENCLSGIRQYHKLPKTEEVKEKIRHSLKGRKLTEEQKAARMIKISENKEKRQSWESN